MDFIMKGKCWKFGDDMGNDAEILPVPISVLISKKSSDPMELKDYIMAGANPDFPKLVQPGDIIVAGKNFGNGNPHLWGYEVIRALGIGLIAESMARGGYRLAAVAGVSFLPAVEDITRKVNQGDTLEVNFRTGEIKNLNSGELIKTEPLPEFLLEIIEAGGQEGYLKAKQAPRLTHLTPSLIKE